MNDGTLSDYQVTHVDDYWEMINRSVLIVEDHQIIRDGMRKIISSAFSSEFIDILEAPTFDDACRIIDERKGKLDLVLLDINLPDANGIDEVACLKNEWAALPVVVVSASEDWSLAAEFLRAGALGFIPKSSNTDVMVMALKLIFAGGRYFPPQVFETLATSASESAAADETGEKEETVTPASSGPLNSADLSPRQKEVLSLMLEGRSNKEIARELGVSVGTAKNYVAVVLRAYSANTRAKAILAALNEAKSGSE